MGLSGTHKKDESPSCPLYPSVFPQIPDVCMKDVVLSQAKDLCARCCVGRLPSALALLKLTLVSLPVMLSLQLQFAMEWKLK